MFKTLLIVTEREIKATIETLSSSSLLNIDVTEREIKATIETIGIDFTFTFFLVTEREIKATIETK